MTYKETIEYLFQKLPMYQRSGKIAYKADIGNIVEASKILKNPHLNLKSIHVAGTNGKGSTSHMLSSILQEAGYKVGLYTSPHLKDFRERIKINGKMISENSVINFLNEYKTTFEKINMSFFEMTVAMSFYYFHEEKVDIAIIECGLGGRLDSTNIINPELSVITNIGLDHTSLLGNTLEKIATEKAGIIKKNTPVIIGREQEEVQSIFEKKSVNEDSQLIFAENFSYASDLKGNYQKENINTAVTTINHLKGFNISEENIITGLNKVVENTQLLGRWQILSELPLTICDTAHNVDGITEVVKQINNIDYGKLHIVIGMVNDKNINNVLSLLPKNAKYYFCKAKIPRALDEEKLQILGERAGISGMTFPSVETAFKQARENAKDNDLIYVGGSTFVVAEII